MRFKGKTQSPDRHAAFHADGNMSVYPGLSVIGRQQLGLAKR
jgi:hypothetical protein